MYVTKEHVGDVICQYDTGERFMVNQVLTDFMSVQKEDGTYEAYPSLMVNGAVDLDAERNASFHTNLELARMLYASEMAARRRLVPGQSDELDRQEASHALNLIKEQHTTFLARLQTEGQTRKAGPALADQFLDDLIQQEPGTTAVFFGSVVQYCCDHNGPSFYINGKLDKSREAASTALSELTAVQPNRTASFEALLKSAKDRAAQQNESPTLSYDLNR